MADGDPDRERALTSASLGRSARQPSSSSISERNARFFEAEADKLDGWADDLKVGLEREIKELDRQIKEARRAATTALTLEEKLAGRSRSRRSKPSATRSGARCSTRRTRSTGSVLISLPRSKSKLELLELPGTLLLTHDQPAEETPGRPLRHQKLRCEPDAPRARRGNRPCYIATACRMNLLMSLKGSRLWLPTSKR